MRSRTASRDPGGGSRAAHDLVLTLWTSDPELAARADAAGIDRIGIDLERLGKAERQRSRGTWLSRHEEHDLTSVAPVLRRAAAFARVNPLNADSPREIDAVIGLGARVVMLPMVRSAHEAERFAAMVDARATTVLLVEQRDALARMKDLVRVGGVDEVHIGLNDLALSLGLRNRWLALESDLIPRAGAVVLDTGLRFGLGGIGRAGDEDLPIPSRLVHAQYARTGATAALVSRSFFGDGQLDLAVEIALARRSVAQWRTRSAAEIAAAHDELVARARQAGSW